MVQYGKGLISVFPEFFASITKISFWHGNWALGYHSKKFSRYFVRHLVMQLKHTMFVTNNHSSFTCSERKVRQNIKVSKYYENDYRSFRDKLLLLLLFATFHQLNTMHRYC